MPGDQFVLKRSISEGQWLLTLNHPQRGNALGPDLVQALTEQMEAACSDPQVHTVVLMGQGPHFCTGLDLSDLSALSDSDLLWRLVHIENLLSLIWNAPIRTVAVAHGRTWGAGADLFAACERRLALEDATFRFPGVHFGIALGTRRLAQRMGEDVARQCLLEGWELSADQACHRGLVQSKVSSLDQALAQIAPLKVGRDVAARLRSTTRLDAAGQADSDLAHLVRSAFRPGLKGRIEAYRASLKSERSR